MPMGMGDGGGMQSMMGGVGGGSKKKKNKPRPPVKDFQPQDGSPAGSQKQYHPNVLKQREPVADFQPKSYRSASPSSYHNGGIVKKGGVAKVRKGEKVLTAKEAKKYRKVKRFAGGRTRSRFSKARRAKSTRAKRVISKR